MAIERVRSGLLKVAGYLVPLIQSLPVSTGLMTLPFAGYLILFFSNLPKTEVTVQTGEGIQFNSVSAGGGIRTPTHKNSCTRIH